MSFQQLNRALRTDEENIKEQLNRINSMLKDNNSAHKAADYHST